VGGSAMRCGAGSREMYCEHQDGDVERRRI